MAGLVPLPEPGAVQERGRGVDGTSDAKAGGRGTGGEGRWRGTGERRVTWRLSPEGATLGQVGGQVG